MPLEKSISRHNMSGVRSSSSQRLNWQSVSIWCACRHFDCSGGAKANINPGALSTTRITGRAQNGDDASPAPCCLRVISRRSVYPSPATISTTLESVAVEEDYLIVGRMCCTSLYGSSGWSTVRWSCTYNAQKYISMWTLNRSIRRRNSSRQQTKTLKM